MSGRSVAKQDKSRAFDRPVFDGRVAEGVPIGCAEASLHFVEDSDDVEIFRGERLHPLEHIWQMVRRRVEKDTRALEGCSRSSCPCFDVRLFGVFVILCLLIFGRPRLGRAVRVFLEHFGVTELFRPGLRLDQ